MARILFGSNIPRTKGLSSGGMSFSSSLMYCFVSPLSENTDLASTASHPVSSSQGPRIDSKVGLGCEIVVVSSLVVEAFCWGSGEV